MTFAAAWALLGLPLLPLAAWLHRRRRRRAPLVVPSLIFLQDELGAPPPRRRLFDAQLALLLLALGLLVLAASGPAVLRRPAGRTLRFVVSGGAPATARGYDTRIQEVLAQVRGALDPADRLVVTRVPASVGAATPRPLPNALLGDALGAPAGWRAVLTDAAAPRGTPGVHWLEVGRADATNAGIVAASTADPAGGPFSVFANVQQSGAAPASLRLVVRAEGRVLAEVPLDVPADGLASTTLELPRRPLAFSVALETPDGGAWRDDFAADDRVSFTAEPLRVWLDEDRLPIAHQDAVRRGLEAALGRGGFVVADAASADLHVVAARAHLPTPAPEGPLRLVLHPVPRGAPAVRAERAPDLRRPDPLVRDLVTHGVDLRYDERALAEADGLDVVLARAGTRRWPVVARGARAVHLLPDPTAGSPAPTESPLWPLLVDNLVREVAGPLEAGGYRRRGLLDVPSSRLGRRRSALDVGAIEGLQPDAVAVVTPLRGYLVLPALLALVALWIRPRLRRHRLRGRPRGRHDGRPGAAPPVPSSP